MKKILFVCTGNTCRSPMAQGIFNDLALKKNLDYVSQSAGLSTMAGLPYSENAVNACKEIGVDIKDGHSVSINDVNLNEFDLIVPMSVNHAQELVLIGAKKDKICLLKSSGVCDPYGSDINGYRSCCEEIKGAVEKLIEKL